MGIHGSRNTRRSEGEPKFSVRASLEGMPSSAATRCLFRELLSDDVIQIENPERVSF